MVWKTNNQFVKNTFFTCIPPDGWWIIILEWGNACLLPFVPAANKTLPILQACPMHQVDTSGFMYIIVSYMPRPAVTLPPGLKLYIILIY